MKARTFIIASNLSFIIPLITAIYYGYYFWSFLILAVIVLSVLYHSTIKNRHIYQKSDQVFAWALIVFNSIMVLNGRFYINLYFYITMFGVLVSLYFYYQQSRAFKFHALWHIIGAFITLFSIITALSFK